MSEPTSFDTSNRPVSSRWWWGVAIIPLLYILVWVGVAGLEFFSVRVPGDPPSLAPLPGTVRPFLYTALTVGVSIILVTVLNPVFVVSLYKDVTAVRAADAGWKPSKYGYGLVSLIHLVGILIPLVYFVTLPAAVYYLYQRHRHVGVP